MFKFLWPLVVGIGVAWSTRAIITWEYWMVAAFISTLVCVYFLFTSFEIREKRWRIVVASILSLGLFAATRTQMIYEQTKVEWPNHQATYIGDITQVIKQYGQGNAMVEVKLRAPDKAWHNRLVRVQLQGETTPKVGNRLAFSTHINEKKSKSFPGDFDYEHYLLLHGVSGSAYTVFWREISTTHTDWRTQLLHWREQLLSQYGDFFKDKDLAILSALTLGDKSQLESDTRQLFSDTGTSHVLALSGLHLSIIFSLLQMLLLHKRLMRRHMLCCANGLIIAALWGFVFLAGAPLSLLRSAIMLTMLQLGLLFNHNQHSTLNNLFIAAFVLLICDPLSLFDVGFQLSFTAVFSILLANQYVWQRFPLPVWRDAKYLSTYKVPRPQGMTPWRYWKHYKHPLMNAWIKRNAYHVLRYRLIPFVGISLSAQWGTIPLVIYYFHNIAPYAWIANFIVIPAAYALLNGALLFFILPIPGLRWIISWGMKGVLSMLTSGLTFISHWPGAVWQCYPTLITLALIWLLPMLLYAFFQLRRRKRKLRLIYTTFTLLTISIAAEVYDNQHCELPPSIYLYRVPQTEVIHFVASSQISYLLSTTTPDSTNQRMTYIEQRFFRPHHVTTPIYIRSEHERHKYLLRSGDFYEFQHLRIYHLHQRLAVPKDAKPIHLDLLIVSKGCKQSLTELAPLLRPQRVALSPRLSTFYCDSWLSNCQKAGIPCQIGGWISLE